MAEGKAANVEDLSFEKAPRIMRLTPALAALVPPLAVELPDRPRSPPPEGYAEATIATLLTQAPRDAFWCFAYGSLIWKPGFDFVEKRVATAKGWHRAFCIGWDRYYRGSPERPGLMLSLDIGGDCQGVAFRLQPDALETNLDSVIRREPPIPPVWVEVATTEGPLRAFAFVVHRDSPAYMGGLSREAIADALATARGKFGSMAEYLEATVTHLEVHGIHDPELWAMQELVAERIEAAQKRG